MLFAGSKSDRPPFALHLWPQSQDQAGRVLEVTLFGEAYCLYPWAVSALQSACSRGLGRSRQRFQLEEVSRLRPDRSRRRLCSGDLSRLDAALPPDSIGPFVCPGQDPGPVQVRLLSPARFVRDGKLLKGNDPVPFQILIARILDRLQGLYGKESSEVLQAEVRRRLEDRASTVPLLSHEIEWVEVPDYSARSRTEMSMGGKLGWLLYGEEAARFLPILRAGEIVHVGKNPTSGCGRIQVDQLESEQISGKGA